MFKATSNRGFHLTFRNEITISVQWGAGSYAAGVTETPDLTTATSAEIMIWHGTSDHTLSFGANEVKGYLSADQVAVIIANTAAAVSLADLETRLQAAGFIDIF